MENDPESFTKAVRENGAGGSGKGGAEPFAHKARKVCAEHPIAFSEIDMGAWRLAKRGSAEGGAEALRGQARGSRSCQRGRFGYDTRGAARARRCRRDRRGGEIVALLHAPGGSRGASRARFQARKSPMRIAWGRFPGGCGARLAHCYLGHMTEARKRLRESPRIASRHPEHSSTR